MELAEGVIAYLYGTSARSEAPLELEALNEKWEANAPASPADAAMDVESKLGDFLSRLHRKNLRQLGLPLSWSVVSSDMVDVDPQQDQAEITASSVGQLGSVAGEASSTEVVIIDDVKIELSLHTLDAVLSFFPEGKQHIDICSGIEQLLKRLEGSVAAKIVNAARSEFLASDSDVVKALFHHFFEQHAQLSEEQWSAECGAFLIELPKLGSPQKIADELQKLTSKQLPNDAVSDITVQSLLDKIWERTKQICDQQSALLKKAKEFTRAVDDAEVMMSIAVLAKTSDQEKEALLEKIVALWVDEFKGADKAKAELSKLMDVSKLRSRVPLSDRPLAGCSLWMTSDRTLVSARLITEINDCLGQESQRLIEDVHAVMKQVMLKIPWAATRNFHVPSIADVIHKKRRGSAGNTTDASSSTSSLMSAHSKDLPVFASALLAMISHEPVTMVSGTASVYHPCPVLQRKDSGGHFALDPLFGHLSVSIVRTGPSPFPSVWRFKEQAGSTSELLSSLLEVNVKPQSSKKFLKSLDELMHLVQSLNPHIDTYDLHAQLLKQDISSISALQGLDEKDWTKLSNHISVGRLTVLQSALSKCTDSSSSSTSARMTPFAEIHACRLFFRYHGFQKHISMLSDLSKLPWLSMDAVQRAGQMAAEKFHGPQLLKTVVKDFYMPYTAERSKEVESVMDFDRGVLLYGPPGTGKSRLNELLPEPAGIVLVATPMSAGELARPYVGQTEALIKDLCKRAELAPWLLFGWVVDETDAMAPKRSSGSGNSGGQDNNASKLSSFLSVVGGSTNVPNLVVLGATNRLESMDDAVLRRLSGQFYVGKPDFSSRKLFLTKGLVRALAACHKKSLSLVDIDTIAHMTINYSGAAMKKLVMRLFLNSPAEGDTGSDVGQGSSAFTSIVRGVCQQMRVTLSRLEVPLLMQEATPFTLPILRAQLTERSFIESCTRRIFISGKDKDRMKRLPMIFEVCKKEDLTAKSMELRPQCTRCNKVCKAPNSCQDGGNCSWYDAISRSLLLDKRNNPSSTPQPSHEPRSVSLIPDVIRELVYFADSLELTSIIIVDRSYLQEKGCYDESKSLEELQSIFNERTKAPSLIILDLDSIAGISLSQSTGFSGSLSYNVSHPALFNVCLAEFLRCRAAPPTIDNHWMVAYAASDVTIKLFQDLCNFPQSQEDVRLSSEAGKKRKCTACGQQYCNKDNKPEACKYHPGKLFEIVDGIHFERLGPMETGFDNDPASLGLENRDNTDSSTEGAAVGIDDNNAVSQQQQPQAHQPRMLYYSCCGQKPGPGGCHSKLHDEKTFSRTRMSFAPEEKKERLRVILSGNEKIAVDGAILLQLKKRCPSAKFLRGGAFPDMSVSVFERYVVPYARGEDTVPSSDNTTRNAKRVLALCGFVELASKLRPPMMQFAECWLEHAIVAPPGDEPWQVVTVPDRGVTSLLVVEDPYDSVWSAKILIEGRAGGLRIVHAWFGKPDAPRGRNNNSGLSVPSDATMIRIVVTADAVVLTAGTTEHKTLRSDSTAANESRVCVSVVCDTPLVLKVLEEAAV